jgi:hypothetical protein
VKGIAASLQQAQWKIVKTDYLPLFNFEKYWLRKGVNKIICIIFVNFFGCLRAHNGILWMPWGQSLKELKAK